ncbi:zinc finger and SCAN domain-containing protein 31-like [Brachionichthys hirsutus]|uniref:zinc finger and SCAN domain-containing protein 31-like n=1 Tax=Brachionichthys hirsutus TaxID=412623 RepID=UPI0036044916
MSSVEFTREFVNQRLTAAADEIFRAFHGTVVRYEEEIERQRRLLEICWKPELRLKRIELSTQHGCREEEEEEEEEEEVQADQEMQSSLDPEPPQIKDEEEFCASPDGPLVLKVETDAFVLSSVHNGSECSLDQQDPEPLQIKEEEEEPCTSQEAEQLEPRQGTDSFILSSIHDDSETEADPQLLLDASDVTADEEPRAQEGHRESASESVIGEKSVRCEICGKAFRYKSKLKTHLRTHTGERLFTCKTCDEDFRFCEAHTGERPYLCKVCGKTYFDWSHLARHTRTHADK